MGRTAGRIKDYASARGKMKEMSLEDIYYKTVELRTVLCDIAYNHKKWGREWYELVELSMLDEAVARLLICGKGKGLSDAISKIQELADLEANLKARERR